MALNSSSGHTGSPPSVPSGTGNPPEVLRPYSDFGREVHMTRASSPVRSAYRVSHPPDGLLPPLPSDPEGSVPLMGFTLQSVCPAQSRTPFSASYLPAVPDIVSSSSEDLEVTVPRGSKVLLPARIRTREPAEAGRGPMLSWGYRLSRAISARRGSGFPDPSLLRFVCPRSERGDIRRSRALPDERPAAGPRGPRRLS